MQMPKNVRQIGEVDDDNRIYIEDYVYTYIHQIKKNDFPITKILMLLGHEEVVEDKNCSFISGALFLEEEWFDGDKIEFTDYTWSNIYKNLRIYFNNLQILGWVYIKNDFSKIKQDQILHLFGKEISGNKKIMLRVLAEEEPEEQFFYYSKGKLIDCPGYFIYYERNEMMQSYIQAHSKMGNLNCEEVFTEESEEKEDVTKHFRSLIQERKEEVNQKKVMTYLYMTSTFLVVIVFVIGITMMNNYDKMKSMEASLQYISEALEEKEKAASDNVDVVDNADEAMQVIADEDMQSISNNEGEQIGKVEEEAAEMESEVVQQEVVASEAADVVPSEDIVDTNKTYDTYTVIEGDTLAKICKDYYGNYDMMDQLCELNQIKNRDKILYGQKILLP
jgi:hypothetical protein